VDARPLLRRTASALPAAMAVTALLAAAVRIALRDRVDVLAVLFYAFPPAVLSCAFLAAGLGFLARRRRLFAALSLAAAVACAFWWRSNAFVSNPPDARSGNLRVLQWNVSHPEERWGEVAARIRALAPDVALLAEAWEETPVVDALWRRLFPGYEIRDAGGRVALLTRLPIRGAERIPLGSRGLCMRYLLDFRGRPLHVFQADLSSSPLRSRRPPLDRLRKLLEPLSEEPVLVAGDFNTPADSIFLDPLRARFSNAFEAAGNGCVATWPSPFPVLSLDQVWASRALVVRRCEIGASLLSDHRWVFAELSLPAESETKEPPRAR